MGQGGEVGADLLGPRLEAPQPAPHCVRRHPRGSCHPGPTGTLHRTGNQRLANVAARSARRSNISTASSTWVTRQRRQREQVLEEEALVTTEGAGEGGQEEPKEFDHPGQGRRS